MIGSLNGTVFERDGDELIVDVAGVGYQVTVTHSVLGRGASQGTKLRLYIYTDVKENAISLFGFADKMERELFLLLKKVKGVGSRLALTIVSVLSADELFAAIGRGEVDALKRVPGVGKKTAERLIVELREQVGVIAQDAGQTLATAIDVTRLSSGGTEFQAHSAVAQDAILALEKLGVPADKARRVVAVTLETPGADQAALAKDAGELVKAALVNL